MSVRRNTEEEGERGRLACMEATVGVMCGVFFFFFFFFG